MRTPLLRRLLPTLALFLCSPALLSAQGARSAVADTIVIHGKVYTLDVKQPWAQALAIRNSKIVAVGGQVVYQSDVK